MSPANPWYPNFAEPDWRIGFSIPTGGVVTLEALEQLRTKKNPQRSQLSNDGKGDLGAPIQTATSHPAQYRVAEAERGNRSYHSSSLLNTHLGAIDLALLQQLAQVELPDSMEMRKYEGTVLMRAEQLSASADRSPLQPGYGSPGSNGDLSFPAHTWSSVERILRNYAQYHFDRPIRSATLIDACFAAGT
ncbi:hypothetical protein [Kovacikia minuta]|uniref:hypothetical protein n=1 Tax=Kovacikia minuta TaxID=2931930 RepID=UPI0020C7AE2D